VIGVNDERAREVIAEVYRPLHLNAQPILYTDRRTAELTKYVANSFLATKIAFINEIAVWAKRSVPTCRRWRAGSVSTIASGRNSSTPGPDSEARASRRTRWP
jgi:hypothetical protein